MFNLLVSGNGWAEGGRDTIPLGRILEHTDDRIRERFSDGRREGGLNLDAMIGLPSLFLAETGGDAAQLAKVATILRARVTGRDVVLEYAFDATVPPIANQRLEAIRTDLDIVPFEFTRTHWAIKDVDLFRVLLRHAQPRRQQPRVFRIDEIENVEPTLISAMMPFSRDFDGVYKAIRKAAEAARLRCRRADDIWENPAVIQDVVSLIDRSKVVVCDCSGRNPNVFYEAGIAHTLGREVILITQNEGDIPFDLRHLRYVRYLNNRQGLGELTERLQARLADLA
jgi:hypothetical protein